MIKNLILLCFLALFMTACSTNTTRTGNKTDDNTANGRYKYSQDHAPTEIPNLDNVKDAVPRYEPYSRGGNKDYRVRGIDYKVWRGITELTEKGGASWYGQKFQGHLTSNGERYNMFTMTAAHKNLPLPSYVQVTNLQNNKKIIVRINDRGPFHDGRIIDLSYVAAAKLDILNAGTGQVEVKLIHFNKDSNQPDDEDTSPIINGNFTIQYLVTSSAQKAAILTRKLTDDYKIDSYFEHRNGLYFLRVGPITNAAEAEKLLQAVQIDYPKAYIINNDNID
jgi:rare lipoprotein A